MVKPSPAFWKGKRVLVTGHTGFKGGWLCEWLLAMGAHVFGYSLPPPTSPSLFDQLEMAGRLDHQEGDVRDLASVRRRVMECRPDVVIHLAAQALVRVSYREPVETYAVNVMGTVHLLESLRALPHRCAAVLATTDKCYENREWVSAYRENDPLGGHDPYSSSKGCAEIAIASFRRCFFPPDSADTRVGIASARAGNVIGGGDWSADRIVPDCMRALAEGRPIVVRNPNATRPWQHVLDPLSGYLVLAEKIWNALDDRVALPRFAAAYNFGPWPTSNISVSALVEEILRHWPGLWEDHHDPRAPHEAKLLSLAIDHAVNQLGWQPTWGVAESVRHTVAWYRRCADAAHASPAALRALCQAQIAEFQAQSARH